MVKHNKRFHYISKKTTIPKMSYTRISNSPTFNDMLMVWIEKGRLSKDSNTAEQPRTAQNIRIPRELLGKSMEIQITF
jgi:hypothetical protein